MHRALLRGAALLGLLAIMAAAGGCVALYTVSKAAERPGDAGEGAGLPLFPPDTAAPSPSATAIAPITTQARGGDGLPFVPPLTDTPLGPASAGTDTPAVTTEAGTNGAVPSTTSSEPPADGPPPFDEIRRPTLPATPL